MLASSVLLVSAAVLAQTSRSSPNVGSDRPARHPYVDPNLSHGASPSLRGSGHRRWADPNEVSPQVHREHALEEHWDVADVDADSFAPLHVSRRSYSRAAVSMQPSAPVVARSGFRGLAKADARNAVSVAKRDWRYVRHEGRWWYYRNNGEWVYWSDGHWAPYLAQSTPAGQP